VTELQPTSALLSAASPSRDDAPATYYGLSLDTWFMAGSLGALFVAVYWVVLRWLWDKTNPFYGEANWGHGVCIPVVGLYYLYINRDELLKAPVRSNWLGLGITVGALVMFGYGIWPGQNQFIQGMGMILALFGIVLLLCGWQVMKVAWFPIAYLVCGIPWPALVYSYIASPLQELAAKVAVQTLLWTGVNAYRTGTKINMGGITEPVRTLNVAEACAGLRSLMTFITVGAAVAFLSVRPLWQKIVITVSAIPIAIFCNVARVAGQGLLDHYISRQLSESFAHQFVGLIMLIPAFFLILTVGWVLDHIFIEEADVRTSVASGNRPRPIAAAAAPRMITAPVTSAPKAGAPAPAVAKTPSAGAAPKPTVAAGSAKTQAAPVKPPMAGNGQQRPAPAPQPRPAGAPVVPPRPGITPPRPAGAAVPRPKVQQQQPQVQQQQQPPQGRPQTEGQ
jgi:exosortase